MKKAILDGNVIKDRADLHDALKSSLGLPEWYGRNLDALYDCLTDISEDTTIVIKDADALKKSLGAYAEGLLSVLRGAADKNPRITAAEEY